MFSLNMGKNPKQWEKLVPSLQFSYNYEHFFFQIICLKLAHIKRLKMRVCLELQHCIYFSTYKSIALIAKREGTIAATTTCN